MPVSLDILGVLGMKTSLCCGSVVHHMGSGECFSNGCAENLCCNNGNHIFYQIRNGNQHERSRDGVSCYNGKLYDTECVAYCKTSKSKHERFARETVFNAGAAEHCHRDKAEDEAAGCSKKCTEAAAHTGVNRNTDRTEYDVKCSGCTA